ncbi:protein kinase domain-containing protein [Tundrisphaera lichenicola]|uniref:serine/threonine protein kinase n=1 Tax=Tundrisphaera lichenicola TaxID=2029860 RepID=UPI003EBDE225
MNSHDDRPDTEKAPRAVEPDPTAEDSLMTRVGSVPLPIEMDFSETLSHTGRRTQHFAQPCGDGPAGEQTRFGEYEIVRRIAKGGMGFVYEARHVKLGLPVALKMIGAGDAATEADVQRFLIEAQAVAKLHKHPNIVKIYSISEECGQHFFAMQLIRGGSLRERMADYAADPRLAAELMLRVADAIAHAHRRGVLHRDLKPDNILIDEEGAPYVTDFGLAKRVDPTDDASMTIGPDPVTKGFRSRSNGPGSSEPERSKGSTRGFDSSQDAEGSILGTPSFMPPEQAQGRLKDISTLSDVYSLGATLFAMLCKRPPFLGPGVQNVLNQVISERPPSPQSLNPKVDRDLDAICLKCLEKSPQDRYESAEAFGRDLHRWLDGKPVHARPVTLPEKIRKWSCREPLQAKMAAVGLILLVLGVGTAVSTVLSRLQLRHERSAKLIAERDRKLAVQKAEMARAGSTLTLRTAGEAVERLIDAFESELGAEANQQALRMRILGVALRYFEKVVRDNQGKPDDDSSGRLALAEAHQQVAKLAGKMGANRNRDVIENYEAAIRILEGVARPQSVGGEEPPVEVLAQLGNTYVEYGIIKAARGDSEQALALYAKARDVYRRACLPCVQHDGARDGCKGDIAVRSGLGRSWGYAGDMHELAGRIAEAREAYVASHKIRTKLYEDFKDDPQIEPGTAFQLAFQLARSFGNLAALDRHRGELNLAILKEQKAVELQESLLATSTNDLERRQTREDMAYYLRKAARFRLENGEPEKAIVEAKRALAQDTALIEDKPGVTSYRIEEAAAQLVLAEVLIRQEKFSEATEACAQAENLLESARDFGDVLEYKLAQTRWNTAIGKIALHEGRLDDAREPLTRARLNLHELIEADRHHDEYHSDHAEVLALLAEVQRDSDPAIAGEHFRDALEEQQELMAEGREGARIKLYQSRLKWLKAMQSRFP